MEKRKLRKKAQRSLVFQFFDIITGKKENGLTFKKVMCKFCQWRSVMNTTRMVAHIRVSCKKSSPEATTLILQYYGNGKEKWKKCSRLKSKIKIPADTITSKTALVNNECNTFPDEIYKLPKAENSEVNSAPLEDWSSTAELLRRIVQIPTLSLDVPQSNTSQKTVCKYEMNLVDDISSEVEAQTENDFSSDAVGVPLPINVHKEEKENENHQSDIKAFSEFIYYELETIKNLEIVNEVKHDICNLLYTAKKQYLQNKK